MLSKVFSAGLFGIDGFIVSVEVNGLPRLPQFELVGLPDAAVKEAKERVRTACENSGFPFPEAAFLVNLAPAHQERLKALRPEASMAEWAFRFLQSIPDVAVTLSGMSNYEQMAENVRIYEESKPLTKEEWDTVLSIADEMIAQKKLPCTSCRYCTNYCPMSLNIPALIGLYNGKVAEGKEIVLGEELSPTLCIGCQACEAVCPQNIKISEMMPRLASLL